MYSVFLVEDEIVTREGIRTGIPWTDSQYSLVGEAQDGELALQSLRDLKPDILITDIKMPFMDGLELSRIIKRDFPWMKIIILSGHDEFEYAQQAISIGVEEYLLKPISSAEMLCSLNKVAEKIADEKRQLHNIESLKMIIQSNEEIIKEKWLFELITGQIDMHNAMRDAQEFGIDLIANGYIVMIVDIHTMFGNYTQLAIVKRILVSILRCRGNILFFPQSPERQIILIKDVSRESLDDVVYVLAQGLKFEVERNTECKLSIGIGSIVNHISEIVDSYADADRAVRYMHLTGKRNIISTADMEWTKAGAPLCDPDEYIKEKIRFAVVDDIADITAQLIELCGDKQTKHAGSGYYAVLYSDIIDAVASLVEGLQGNPRIILTDIYRHECIAEASESGQMFFAKTRLIIEKWIEFRDSSIRTKQQYKVQEAKKFIETRYNQTDLSLFLVASHVKLSPNHFSTVFAQEVGETFIEYLTSVRISRAKHILSHSDMKCADITFEVGYSDPHYFSFIFKKNTGISPTDFRLREKQ